MINNTNDIVVNLKDKIEQVISLYEKEKQENNRLKMENQELLDKSKNLGQQFSELQTKYNNLKLAKTIASTGEDSHDAKLKINRIVREIDKCIAMLNR
jgi:cell shape-determining protein MreC